MYLHILPTVLFFEHIPIGRQRLHRMVDMHTVLICSEFHPNNLVVASVMGFRGAGTVSSSKCTDVGYIWRADHFFHKTVLLCSCSYDGLSVYPSFMSSLQFSNKTLCTLHSIYPCILTFYTCIDVPFVADTSILNYFQLLDLLNSSFMILHSNLSSFSAEDHAYVLAACSYNETSTTGNGFIGHL